VIETEAGSRVISLDLPGSEQFEQPVTLKAGENAVDLRRSPEFALVRLKASIKPGIFWGKAAPGSSIAGRHSRPDSQPQQPPW